MLKRSLKALVSSVAITACALIVAIKSPQIHNSYLRYEVGDSVVKVLVGPGKGGGTGFAVKADSGREYIATNRHVCEATNTGWMYISKDDGFTVWKRIVYIDKNHDLCLLEGDRRLDALTIGKIPNKGDFHYIVGHPGLRPLTVSSGEFVGNGFVTLVQDVLKREQCDGTVYELNPLEMLLFGQEFVCLKKFRAYHTTAVSYPGNSGSPAVDAYGNVIGVLFAGSTESERDNYLVPVTELKRVLSKF